MNRLSYDTCAYTQAVAQSVTPLAYLLDPVKYVHCDKCRIELGVVGGTAVSHVSGNMVDLENNLFGIDRPGTQCNGYKYAPVPVGGVLQGKDYNKPVDYPKIPTTLQHLPKCQLSAYPGVPAPPAPKPFVCAARQ